MKIVVDCDLAGRRIYGATIKKVNHKTVWIKWYRPISRYGKWVPTTIQRHDKKHNCMYNIKF